MKTRIIHLWKALNSSLWFIPGLMTAATIALSFATVTLDDVMRQSFVEKAGWLWAGGPDGAREILSAIASSMITVAGVVFSITVVVLTLASSQFGPRLLRSFMRDRGNQIVLGTFISTFTYCLLVLRTVRGQDGGDEFAPYISVTVAIVLALASLGVLIFFIHHVSLSIQAPIIVARVAEDLNRSIEKLYPERLGEDDGAAADAVGPPAGLEIEGTSVASRASGYLQAIDGESLMDLATRKNLVIRLNYRPGQFVLQGSDFAIIWPPPPDDKAIAEAINASFILGAERTEEQDVEFTAHQLVEVAVRALSPSINDPFTALSCVDRLGAGLSRLAQRQIPSAYRYDHDHRLRVIARGATFEDVSDVALAPIRQYGRSSALVMQGLLSMLTRIAPDLRRDEDRQTILRHAALIESASRHGLVEEADRQAVEECYRKVLEAIDKQRAGRRREAQRAKG